MTEVVAQVNPDDPDTEFLAGVQSIVRGDGSDFVDHFEEALQDDVKHNEFLLRDYAQHLVASGADWRRINEAVNRWRENYPFSDETLTLELGTGPRTQADVSILHRELRAVPWIGDVQLESDDPEPDGVPARVAGPHHLPPPARGGRARSSGRRVHSGGARGRSRQAARDLHDHDRVHGGPPRPVAAGTWTN